MKILYATSVRYPSPYANRIQILATSAALHSTLGEDFILAANTIDAPELYTGPVLACHTRFGPRLAWQQLRFAKKHGFTTIFSREIGLLFFLMVFNTLWFHAPLRFVYEAHEFVPSWKFRYVLRRVAHVFCLTALLQEAIQDYMPGLSASVLPDAVAVDSFIPTESREESRARLGLPQDARIAMYIGRLDGWKGMDSAYAAAKELPEGTLFVVVGGRTHQVPELSRTYPYVRFLGPHPYTELPNTMIAADVLVIPNTATQDISAKYTSPLKLFAYMTSGKPIVASDLPSIREVVDEKSAYLVTPDDPHALAKGIVEALGDPHASVRAACAKELVRQYTWESRAESILKALHAIS